MKINEVEATPADGFIAFSNKIRTQCSDYLNSADTPLPLYRGMHPKGQTNAYFIKPIRQNRTPMDMSPLATEIINRFIEKKFGIKNARNSCAFCTGDIFKASDFGTPQYVFPVNGSKFIVNRTIDSNHIGEIIDQDAEETIGGSIGHRGPYWMFKAETITTDYDNPSIQKDLRSSFLDYMDDLEEEYLKTKIIEISLSDLNKYIEAMYEIMICESQEYFCIEAGYLENYVNDKDAWRSYIDYLKGRGSLFNT